MANGAFGASSQPLFSYLIGTYKHTTAGSGLPRDFGVMTKILINFLLPFRSISRDPLAGDTINGMANNMNRG